MFLLGILKLMRFSYHTSNGKFTNLNGKKNPDSINPRLGKRKTGPQGCFTDENPTGSVFYSLLHYCEESIEKPTPFKCLLRPFQRFIKPWRTPLRRTRRANKRSTATSFKRFNIVFGLKSRLVQTTYLRDRHLLETSYCCFRYKCDGFQSVLQLLLDSALSDASLIHLMPLNIVLGE